MSVVEHIDRQTISFKEQLVLFLPLTGVALLTTVFPFLEKLLLSRFSLESMEAAITVTNVCNVVRVPCVAIAFMTQVHVGRLAGAGKSQEIGPCIWQMIWFSLLSMILTVPITLIYGHYYFADTVIRDLALPYLYLMTAGNFLFPLGAALSCFYLGNRRGKELFRLTFIVQAIGFCLAYILIFGVHQWIPPLGIIGAGIALLGAQLIFCLLLLRTFLQANPDYSTFACQLRFSLLWEYLRPALARSLSRSSLMAAWTVISYVIIHKSSYFLLALTLGSAIWEICSVLAEGLLQLTTTEVSRLIGSCQTSLIAKPFHRGLIFAGGISAFLAIPFLIFPHHLFNTCFSAIPPTLGSLNTLSLGLWLCFTFDTLSVIGVGYILSFKDTFHLTGQAFWCWIFECGLAYLILKYIAIQPVQIWLVIGCGLFLNMTANLLRAMVLKERYQVTYSANNPTCPPTLP